MKSNEQENNILRKVDAIGRITISPKILNQLKLDIGDSIIMYIDEKNDIVLRKNTYTCVFCDSDNILQNTDKVEICTECKRDYNKVNRLVGNRFEKQSIPNGRRLVIPFKIRKQLNINTGDEIQIIPFDAYLLLKVGH